MFVRFSFVGAAPSPLFHGFSLAVGRVRDCMGASMGWHAASVGRVCAVTVNALPLTWGVGGTGRCWVAFPWSLSIVGSGVGKGNDVV